MTSTLSQAELNSKCSQAKAPPKAAGWMLDGSSLTNVLEIDKVLSPLFGREK